jgi:hypothetical protein
MWVQILSCRVVLDKVSQWLAAYRWFSPGTPFYSTNKTDSHDNGEQLLKMALNTITLTLFWVFQDICVMPLGGHMRLTLYHDQWKWQLRDYERIHKLLCMLRTICLAGKDYISIYHIIKYSWHKVTHLWPIMRFPQTPHHDISVNMSKWEIWF